MFHEGDLQSGIAKALQESKPVVCFVSDNGENSTKWEHAWLQQEDIRDILSNQAVALKLEAGSQEAGFLSAICPVTEYPTILVIKEGQVTEHLKPDTDHIDFSSRLSRAISEPSPTTTQPLNAQTTTDNPPPTPAQQPLTTGPSPTPTQSFPTPVSQNPPAPMPSIAPIPTQPTSAHEDPPAPVPSLAPVSPQSQSQPMQDMWAERRSRLEAQRKARETAEKAAAAERAKAQKAAETETSSSSSTSASASATTNVNASRATYLQQQAHRKREAKADRERVLKLLENDKIARREREEARKAAARAALLASGEGQDASVLTQQLESETVPAASPSASRAGAARCALQVRLLDGSTIRSNFPSDTTITAAVRPWISEHINDANSPYTFKQVLTPLPSRALGVSDEVATLRDLGLAPSATLVLVPVQNAVGSILGGKGGGYNSVLSGYVMRAIGRVLGVVEGVYGFFGFGTGAQVQQNANDDNGEASGGGDDSKAEGQSTATAAQGANIRIRTLRDQRADKDESQLYNGNQLNFEPRKKDEDDEEGR